MTCPVDRCLHPIVASVRTNGHVQNQDRPRTGRDCLAKQDGSSAVGEGVEDVEGTSTQGAVALVQATPGHKQIHKEYLVYLEASSSKMEECGRAALESTFPNGDRRMDNACQSQVEDTTSTAARYMPKTGKASTFMERKLEALRQESCFKKGLQEELVVSRHKLSEECEASQRREAVDKLLAEVWSNIIGCERSPDRRPLVGVEHQSNTSDFGSILVMRKSKLQQEIEAARVKGAASSQEERNVPCSPALATWEGLGLGECLSKSRSKLEQEVEAAKASSTFCSSGVCRRKLPHSSLEVQVPSFGECLRPHRSRLALEVDAARGRSDQSNSDRLPDPIPEGPVNSSNASCTEHSIPYDGWGVGWDDLGMKKHRCRVDRDREAWLSSVRASQPLQSSL